MEMQDNFTDETIHKRLADNLSLLKIYAFKLTGDKCRADDLLQETIVKVLYNAAAFVYNGNFKGWATTIMYNIFLNERLRFSRSTSLADDSFFDGEYFDCYIGAREILRVINSLPSEYRLVFLMYADGYKYHEIAEELYIPIGTVKSRIHTARIRLQLLLKDYIG
jgi:RNA polymerase sigma-70 factor (ECF subfamily)